MPRRHPPPASLELTEDQLRDLVGRSLERLLGFLRALPTAPMLRMDGARRRARSLMEPLPEAGRPLPELLTVLFERALPLGLNTASGGYMAYIPGGGLPEAAVADLIAGVTNRYIGIWQAAPGLVALETSVVRWFCDLAGLPAHAGGLLTTGGSMATLIALVTARLERLPEDFGRGVIYTSADAHHSVRKAARFAGFPASSLREVAVDAQRRMDPDALTAAIAADRAAGRTPFCLVATAGTTATGAVDPLPRLAALARAEGLWLHIDAAYGGFFLLTERGRAALAGIEQADSITLDPHKGLFLPYGTGSLLVRDRAALTRAHGGWGSYMPSPEADAGCWDFADMGPELSRDVRGLRVWLPLKLHGAARFREALDEKLDLARQAAERVAAMPGLEILGPPELSLFAFRLRGADDATLKKLMQRVNARQRVLLTGVQLDDGFALRLCVLSFRTHAAQLQAALEDLEAALVELGAAGQEMR